MSHRIRWILVVGVLGGCAHDSLWRIQIDGTLMKDGVEIERFFGRDIDGGYREGDTPELRVHDWRVSEDIQFDVEFRLEDHRSLEDLAEGDYGYAGGAASSERSDGRVLASYHPGSENHLGIVSMGEKEGGDFGPDHNVVDVVFEIKKNANGGIFGVFSGEFTDGYSLVDAEFHMKGFGSPRPEKADKDDDDYGTDFDAGCANFSDTTPYYNDIQVDALCWSAGLAKACGYTSELEYSCQNLKTLLETGTGSLSTCPYC